MRVEIIGEDSTHAAIVSRLVLSQIEAAALEAGPAADWLLGAAAAYVEWCGGLPEMPSEARFTGHGPATLRGQQVQIDGRPVRLRPRIGGQTLLPEAEVWRYRLLGALVLEGDEQRDAIIAARDTDGKVDALAGLEQAIAFFRDERQETRPILIAAPHRDAEGWLVAGFVPSDAQEHARHREACRVLSFSPERTPERLTSRPNDALTDAKRVLRFLLQGETDTLAKTPSRVLALETELLPACSRCLSDLPRLRANGAGCGLSDFLDAVRGSLAPLLWGGRTYP